ncbi:MAG: RNA 2',3'-cyclic phosphodiesterase [Candidatus Heimdallarchaeota archaeon]|nr:RNA 2',3'-cyclic phosphodiesterase [Candidatus Heimdallarchaeota archaeon]
MVRAFICVEITDKEVLTVIGNIITQLKRIQGVKPVKPNQMHLTLKFLDEITEKQIHQIKEILNSWQDEKFELSLEGIGCFPSLKRIRVIWIGIKEGKDTLIRFATKIDSELGKIGFPRETRSFTPHLTLARIKYLKNHDKQGLIRLIQEFEQINAGKQIIQKIILMKSTLTPSGAIYEVLHSVSLS